MRCISPFNIRNKKTGERQDVPCGRCNFCLQNRRNEWSFRLNKEMRYANTAFFITMTYNDKNLPWSDYAGCNVLDKVDVQLFIKRLRKMHSKQSKDPIKYYLVGEYGTKTDRPHYHAIMFNLHEKVSKDLENIWSLGHVMLGTVSNDSIGYVTKYVINKYDYDYRKVKPFAMISNGIGLRHLEENKKLYKYQDVVRDSKGYPVKMPRYYVDKVNNKKPTKDVRAKFRQKRAEILEKREIERLSRIHNDPTSYMEERRNHAQNKISEQAKKGDKL